jgi:hypothetical protein
MNSNTSPRINNNNNKNDETKNQIINEPPKNSSQTSNNNKKVTDSSINKNNKNNNINNINNDKMEMVIDQSNSNTSSNANSNNQDEKFYDIQDPNLFIPMNHRPAILTIGELKHNNINNDLKQIKNDISSIFKIDSFNINHRLNKLNEFFIIFQKEEDLMKFTESNLPMNWGKESKIYVPPPLRGFALFAKFNEDITPEEAAKSIGDFSP